MARRVHWDEEVVDLFGGLWLTGNAADLRNAESAESGNTLQHSQTAA